MAVGVDNGVFVAVTLAVNSKGLIIAGRERLADAAIDRLFPSRFLIGVGVKIVLAADHRLLVAVDKMIRVVMVERFMIGSLKKRCILIVTTSSRFPTAGLALP